MPRLWRPSNRTEGAIFFEEWCSLCARDKNMSEGKDLDACSDEEVCKIIAASFAGPVDEWQVGEDELPFCSAFVPVGALVRDRDDRTIDMIGAFRQLPAWDGETISIPAEEWPFPELAL